jgi:hypothetical protein
LDGKEKTKIRYNFSEDAKRTWNGIKQPSGQAIKIVANIFTDHYAENWETEPKDVLIDDHSDLIMQGKLVFKENDMLNEFLNKKKMKRAITMKGKYLHQGWTN